MEWPVVDWSFARVLGRLGSCLTPWQVELIPGRCSLGLMLGQVYARSVESRTVTRFVDRVAPAGSLEKLPLGYCVGTWPGRTASRPC